MIQKSFKTYSAPAMKAVAVSASRRILSGSDEVYGAQGAAGNYDSSYDNDYSSNPF